ncbi:unnamed protein product [Linum tenue]|uniref:Uncharacterized protein n=1 Tax=Linum tenue TaxID=586396 RepID=A0AAV0JPJ6_9ROSI|nr:unnamed protein product [Linum tenue]
MRPAPHSDRHHPKGPSLPQTSQSPNRSSHLHPQLEILLLPYSILILPARRPSFRRRTPRRHCLCLYRLQQRRSPVRSRRG